MKCYKMILCTALVCLTLCACGNKENSSKPPEVTTVPVTTKSADTAEVRDCVTVGREETYSVTDANKNTVETHYRLPVLTFDTADARAVNQEINNLYAEEFDAAKQAADSGKYTAYSSIDYNAFVNDDIVTVIITAETSGHSLRYNVFNYNKKTSKRLDNAGLLEYLQRDYDQTFAQLKEALEDDYTSKFKAENFPDDYYYQLEETVGDEAVQKSQLYLNGEAELYAVCVEHASIGEGEFQVLISLV